MITDKELVERFLIEKEKRSKGTRYNTKSTIRKFLKLVKKPIIEIDYQDIKKYLDSIDKKKITIGTKNAYRQYVRSFITYCHDVYQLEGITDFKAVMPSKLISDFTKRGDDLEKAEDGNSEILENDEIEQILIHIMENRKYKNRRKQLRDFLLFAIAITTGARISEIRTIRREDIHLTKRYFESGFIKGAMKTTGNESRKTALLFFLPKSLIYYIEEYMNLFDSKWLFPTRTNNRLSYSYIHKNILEKIRKELGFFFTWHTFRRSLISKRDDMDILPHISELLVNHQFSSVEGKSYIKKSLSEKRSLYDEFYPYSELKYIGDGK